MTTLSESFRPFMKICICSVFGFLFLFLAGSLPFYLRFCASGPGLGLSSNSSRIYSNASRYGYPPQDSESMRKFCSDMIYLGYAFKAPIMLLISTFAFLGVVYALKRWLSKLWHDTGSLIIYGAVNLSPSRHGHVALFILAMFRTILRLVVGIAASWFIATLALISTRFPLFYLQAKTVFWIDLHLVFFCLYFSLSYCVVTFLMDNALDRLELCHTLASNLDSSQQKICFGGDDAESGKGEVEDEKKKKPVFHI